MVAMRPELRRDVESSSARKYPRALVCSAATKSSGVLTGAIGTPRRSAAASTSSRGACGAQRGQRARRAQQAVHHGHRQPGQGHHAGRTEQRPVREAQRLEGQRLEPARTGPRPASRPSPRREPTCRPADPPRKLDERRELPWRSGDGPHVAVARRQDEVRSVAIARRAARKEGVAARVVAERDRPGTRPFNAASCTETSTVWPRP